MAKLAWDSFVEKHKAGFGLGTGTNNFPKLTPYAPNGKKWPTPAGIVSAIIKPKMKGDWSITTSRGTIKGQKIVNIHILFESKQDLEAVGTLFGSQLSNPTPCTNLPFRTFDRVAPIDVGLYEKLARHLAYIP